MDPVLAVVAVTAAVLVLGLVALALWLRSTQMYRNLPRGQALVVTQGRRTVVRFEGTLLLPFVQRGEFIDLTTRILEVERRGRDGLICRDNIRADVRARFHVRVNATAEDVLKVANTFGCARGADLTAMRELFAAKFAEALKIAARALDFEELISRREAFRDEVLRVIGADLHGYIVDDLVLDELDQTPIAALDPNNILDAEGIRKITERTVAQEIGTRELQHALEIARAHARVGA